ncbi:MAG: DUF3619 family protein [Gammaproteobacteria bacterium]
MNRDQEDVFLERIRSSLDAGVRDLDGPTLERLQGARRHALASARPCRRRSISLWVPAAAVAGVVALALLLVVGRPSAPASSTVAAQLDAVDVLASGDSLDLYQDLDFYTWLARDADQG